MKSLGTHLLLELYKCNIDKINCQQEVQRILEGAVEVSGATKVESVFHKFSPHGVSGVVIIAESHFTIHTWPEFGFCAIDIFTCGDVIQNEKALKYLKAEFMAQSVSMMETKRGVLDISPDELVHKP